MRTLTAVTTAAVVAAVFCAATAQSADRPRAVHDPIARSVLRAPPAPATKPGQMIAVETIPTACTTDTDCEREAAAFGCIEFKSGFLCDEIRFRRELERRSS